MRSIKNILLLLSFITIPAVKYFLIRRRFYIIDRFTENFFYQGVYLSIDIKPELKLSNSLWEYRKATYLPFIFMNRKVELQRFVLTNQINRFGYDKKVTYYRAVNILIH